MNRPLRPWRSWLLYLALFAPLVTLTLSCGPRPKHKPTHSAQAAPTSHPLATPPTAGPAIDTRPLFERVGGTAAVTKIVDDFVALAANDPKVNFSRKGQPSAWDATPDNVALLKKRLVEFLSAATGGDLHYNGQDMVTAHRGMNITDAEFDACAAALKSALDKNNIAAREQSEFLAVVNRTRSAIVATTPTANSPAPAAKAPEAPTPPPFVPQPITSDESELDPESAVAPDQLNK